MAFEKAKVLKAAEKFLSQGKINAAIKEYRQIVENDFDDLTTLNMLGDLCVRTGEKEEAISCFLRIAEHYREQEFNLKAIAMYKKIERLKPRDPEIASKLADLYAIQGLIVDARAQYLIVADAYSRTGQTKQTLEVLRKIADLDPHNTEIRLKLASGYLKEGLDTEAARAFVDAANGLFETGAFEKALEAFTKALELRPRDEAALKGVVSAHVACGTADEAAELLERAVQNNPDDPGLISMLAQVYVDAQDPKGAERATDLLMACDASNYTRFIEVAWLYLKAGETDEAARILAAITEQMLAGREENDLLELVNEVLARNREHVQALRLLVRIHWWQRDTEKLRAALERLAEAAEAAGLSEEERYALTQLVRLSPEEHRYSLRLIELGGVQEEIVEESAPMPETAEAEIPSFENFAIVAEPGYEESSQLSEVSEFESNSVIEPRISDASASFADLNEDVADSDQTFSTVATFQPGVQEFEFGDIREDSVIHTQVDTAEPEVDSERHHALMAQELESVDFYISQGYMDIAFDTLQMLERQFGPSPEIHSRREKLQDLSPQVVRGPETFEFSGAAPTETNSESVAAGTTEADPILATVEEPASAGGSASRRPLRGSGGLDSGLAEIFEEFRVAAEDEEVSADEDYETHYNMGTAYKEMDLVDEAIQEFQAAAGLVKPGDGTSRYFQCCNMLGHCFVQKAMPRAAVIWFRKALESPGHAEEEYTALRYELGSVYEQMGDYHRSLNMFTEVYGVDVSYREVAAKLKKLQQHRGGKRRK